MVDIQTVSIAIASAGVFAAAVYYILQIRHQTRMRQTDLVIRLYSTRTSKEFQESWRKVMAKEFKDYHNYEKWYEWSDFIEVGLFFEGVGILLNRKLIDIGLVDDLHSYIVKTTWEKIKRVVEDVRKHNNAPQIYEWFEYLYNEMQKRKAETSL
jgi:hypothetical protein